MYCSTLLELFRYIINLYILTRSTSVKTFHIFDSQMFVMMTNKNKTLQGHTRGYLSRDVSGIHVLIAITAHVDIETSHTYNI